MIARKMGGSDTAGTEPATARPGPRRQPDRSQVRTPAEATGRSAATAFACKPKQPAHVVHWRLATAALARIDRRRFPEVKPCPALLSAVRGSRASTDPSTPPDLFNPPKGLSMAKIARVSSQLVTKSVPVAHSLQSAHLPQTRPRETVIQRRYTLCEVGQRSRKDLPTAKPPLSAPENHPASGSIAGPIFQARAAGRVKVSLYFPATFGRSDRSTRNRTSSTRAACKGETARKPIESVFGGAA